MERRRLANREAARRSRICRQVINRGFIISFVNQLISLAVEGAIFSEQSFVLTFFDV